MLGAQTEKPEAGYSLASGSRRFTLCHYAAAVKTPAGFTETAMPIPRMAAIKLRSILFNRD